MDNIYLQTMRNAVKGNMVVKLLAKSSGRSEPTSLLNYRERVIKEDDWEITADDDKVEASSKWCEWEFGGGKSKIYGFFVVNEDGEVLWEERSKVPYEVIRRGDKFRVRPKLRLEIID